MIADLKADSKRWDKERAETLNDGSAQGQSANGIRDSSGNFRNSNTPLVGGYRDSTVHQSRQYYGPTEAAVATPTGGYPSSSAAGGVTQAQEVYSQGYGPGQSYGQPNSYGAPPTAYGHQPDNYSYVAGADYGINQQPPGESSLRGGRNGPLPPAQVPRGATGYPAQPAASYPDPRGNPGGYYPPQNSQGQASSYPAHPGDAYYGRQSTYNDEHVFLTSSPRRRELSNCLGPAVAGYPEPVDNYPDNRQYEQPQYSQGPMSSSSTATANQGAPRRGGGGDRERDQDPRDRHRSHGSGRPHGGRN
jgi:hypothetical protein